MTRKHQWLLVAGIVVVAAGGLAAALELSGYEKSKIDAGMAAPAFTAQTLSEPPVTKSLADYSGSVVLLNIWRTDCLPCEKEMPSLQKLHEEFKDRGLKVVAVTIEPAGSEKKIRDFTARYGLTFEILHEPTGAIGDTYRILGQPETFVIRRDGVIALRRIGEVDWTNLAIRKLIAYHVGTPLGSPGDQPQGVIGGGGDEQ